MPVEMLRIDDRFIHGQVVVGWCPHIKPDLLILCDDEIARSDWERKIYQDAGANCETRVCSVRETAQLLQSDQLRNKKLLVVVESPHVVVQLFELGVPITAVNVGGMHYEPGKRKVAPFIYVDDHDLADFQFLHDHRITLTGKDVPSCKPLDVAHLLHLS